MSNLLNLNLDLDHYKVEIAAEHLDAGTEQKLFALLLACREILQTIDNHLEAHRAEKDADNTIQAILES